MLNQELKRKGQYSVAAVIVLVAWAMLGSRPALSGRPSADSLTIRWGVETNLVDDGARFRSRLTLVNRDDTALSATGWTIYFNFLRQIDPESVSGNLDVTRINGDFYQLAPGEDLAPVAPGTERSITFEAAASAVKRIDAPAGFYIVHAGEEAEPVPIDDVRVTPFMALEQTKRAPNDQIPVPTPERRYEAHQSFSAIPPDSVGRIVPTPASVTQQSG